jgi:5-methylcytosine-specific restriction protein A
MIPLGITDDHVRLALRDFDSKTVEHRFADSTRYDLLVEGRRYPPKAIVGLAARYVTGQALTPEDFSGGEGSSCFRLLRRLGFEIVPKPGVAAAPTEFQVGATYSRADIYRILGVLPDEQGGDWDTGYHRHKDEWFIFCTVGQPGRTGHDYPNRFEGNDLIWTGKTGSRRNHPSIQSMISDELPVHVFFRLADRESFSYAGIAHAGWIAEDRVPVEIRWRFDDASQPRPERPPEEVPEADTYIEGAKQQITVNAYERNPAARRRCLEHHGTTCVVCGFNFETMYGDLGKGFIHVHHLRPLGEVRQEYDLDPIADLCPVCPNCHAMIHARPVALGVEELRSLIRRKLPSG